MTTVDATPWPAGAWRRQLAAAVTDVEALLQMLELHDPSPSATPSAALRFPLRVPRGYVARMRAGDPSDPLLRQVLPLSSEDDAVDGEVCRGLAALAAAGATLLNQTVLLKGVNDSVDAPADLGESLFAAGVMPYYLHMLDPVAGAAHFDVPEGVARELVSDLAARLPGYLVPRLVREVEGAPAKVGVDLWT